MPDLTPTLEDVQLTKKGGGIGVDIVLAGEACDQLDAVFIGPGRKYFKASNNIDEENAIATAIVLSPADAIDGPLIVTSGGTIGPGVALTPTAEYVLSRNQGKIMPKSDLQTGERYTRIGYGSTDGELVVDIAATGILAP